MREELEVINKSHTWTLVDRPLNKPIIGVKWVFRRKLNLDGTLNKYKARLVLKGYNQLLGVDFLETYALVACYDTIRLQLALSATVG